MNQFADLESLNWSEVAASVVGFAYKNRSTLDHWYKKCQVFVGMEATNIVVLGRENVGKTILVEQFCEEVSKIAYEKPTSSKVVEKKVVQFGNLSKIVSVVPGQTSKARNDGLRDIFNANRNLEGVIYVTDWGLTDVRDKIIKQSIIERDNIRDIEQLRQRNLKLELDDFKKVCEQIEEIYTNCGYGPKWLLIATNKVDLFYDTINETQKYYHLSYDSNFTKIAKDLMYKIGEKNLDYKCLPVCAYETPFIWNGHRIPTNLGGNDIRQNLFKHMIKMIAEL
jgi:GTPase SAR1 family protein